MGRVTVTRREFGAGAVSAALLVGTSGARAASASNALEAIRAYADEHRRFFNLPALTLGFAAPGEPPVVINSGYANPETRAPITSGTLFQIGSISKAFTALVLHQFAAEGRLRLDWDVRQLVPEVPLPRDQAVSVQQLLDHVSGLADDPPLFPEGGLWLGFRPGDHWSYSNTGYDLLGHLAEKIGRKPLGQLLRERVLAPLQMTRSQPSIVAADRLLYARGYEAADMTIPFTRGAALAPAAWVDVTTAAGCIASTADDMTHYLGLLGNFARGRGGLGLSPVQGRSFVGHSLASDAPEMRYGNGLMHVADRNRSYLHHTGGMISFSSSFHVDVGSGIGAFASASISAFPEYRPRNVTLFAVQALVAARSGRPVPAPPFLEDRPKSPVDFVGHYSGPSGAFDVRQSGGLVLLANGRAEPLQLWGEDLFRTAHPALRQWSLKFDRVGGKIVSASWGPETFVRAGSGASVPSPDPNLARLAGRYFNDDPWYGFAAVVERGGKLWIGTETPMARIGDNLWRVGDHAWSPERGSFADFIDGRPQSFIFSGVKFERRDS